MSKETTIRPLGYERVYLQLFNVADTPFHIQGDELSIQRYGYIFEKPLMQIRWFFFQSGISVVLDVVYRGCTDLTVEDTELEAVKPVVSAVVLQDPILNGPFRVKQ